MIPILTTGTPLLAALLLGALPSLAPARIPAQVEPRVERVAARGWTDPRGDDLERALAAIEPERVKADVFFLASDELRGRDSPSRGLRIAARYIRTRLQRLGWEPGAPGGSYFYQYELTEYAPDMEVNGAAWTVDGVTHELEFGEDYFLSPGARHDRDASGGIVYGGEFDEDEVGDLDLAGEWVLLEPGTRVSRRRTEAAEEMGVLGFLIPADPEADRPVAERFARWIRVMKAPSLRQRGGGLPQISFSSPLSLRLQDAAGDASIGQAIDGTFRETWRVESRPARLENVCGLWPGSDPELRNEVIILSAHYDHVGVDSEGRIYNGADDNGSGTTGLLAIAEALEAYGPMRRTVLLMWVSAEEKGLLGSKAWTEDPWLPEGMRPLCNINIDMIGRNAPDEISVTPTQARPEYNRLTELVEEHMGAEGFTTLNSADAYWRRSDHKNFSENLSIPVAFLFSDVHEDYHKPTDTPDKIDVDKLSRVARLVVRMLHDLQADDLEF